VLQAKSFALLLSVCLVLYVLNDICELLVADLKEKCTCVRFASDLRILHLELMKCSKQLSVTMPWGKHTFLSCLHESNMRKLWLKSVHIQVIRPNGAQGHRCGTFGHVLVY
jgi:hypothetical protein